MSKSQNKVLIDINFLQKIAEFTRIALSEVNRLKKEAAEAKFQKNAADQEQELKYRQAVKKVATALYNSDFDFVTGDFDQKDFIKRAMSDPSYLARKFEQVCNAADVSLIGKPARVAAVKNKQAEYDPVYARAFGLRSASDFIWEED